MSPIPSFHNIVDSGGGIEEVEEEEEEKEEEEEEEELISTRGFFADIFKTLEKIKKYWSAQNKFVANAISSSKPT